MVELDGSYLEGGGQLVRSALAFSTVEGKSFEVNNIRKGRTVSGLKNQHLFCIKALQELSSSQAEGVSLGSSFLKYWPGVLKGRTLSIDIGTAGSISLLLQALMIPAMFSLGKVRLKINGGTDVKWAMPFDYFNNVVLPHFRRYAEIDSRLEKRGYYPKGGGKVNIKIKSRFTTNSVKEVRGIDLVEQGELVQIKGISHASIDLEKGSVAERQAKAAKSALKLDCPVKIQTEYCDTLSTGSGITLWAIFSKDSETELSVPIVLGADSLGEKGKRAEVVGQEAAIKLTKEIESKACVDEHLADNLIPLLALVGGRIKVSAISKHTLTNIYVCEKFLGKVFEVDEQNNLISTINFINR